MKTPETDAFFDHAISTKSKYPEYCAPFEGFCQKLERERDEARELHIKALREREATEKEVDAMLERALLVERERDEAQEERDNFKQELEIVTARLHGKKHPLDNGIPERREIYIWKNGKYELDA